MLMRKIKFQNVIFDISAQIFDSFSFGLNFRLLWKFIALKVKNACVTLINLKIIGMKLI